MVEIKNADRVAKTEIKNQQRQMYMTFTDIAKPNE